VKWCPLYDSFAIADTRNPGTRGPNPKVSHSHAYVAYTRGEMEARGAANGLDAALCRRLEPSAQAEDDGIRRGVSRAKSSTRDAQKKTPRLNDEV
jgi:hypothetical protein